MAPDESSLDADEVAVLARNVLEVVDAPDLERVTSGGGWLLHEGGVHARFPELEAFGSRLRGRSRTTRRWDERS